MINSLDCRNWKSWSRWSRISSGYFEIMPNLRLTVPGWVAIDRSTFHGPQVDQNQEVALMLNKLHGDRVWSFLIEGAMNFRDTRWSLSTEDLTLPLRTHFTCETLTSSEHIYFCRVKPLWCREVRPKAMQSICRIWRNSTRDEITLGNGFCELTDGADTGNN